MWLMLQSPNFALQHINIWWLVMNNVMQKNDLIDVTLPTCVHVYLWIFIHEQLFIIFLLLLFLLLFFPQYK